MHGKLPVQGHMMHSQCGKPLLAIRLSHFRKSRPFNLLKAINFNGQQLWTAVRNATNSACQISNRNVIIP